MAQIKLKHVNRFLSRGKWRYVCRPPGFKSKTLNGAPGSEAFIADYHDWLARAGVSIEIGAKNTKAGSLNSAIVAYFKDDVFTKGLAASTQDMRRAILNRFRETIGPSGQRYGEKGIATLQRRHILAMLEGMTRDAKKNWIKTLRGLMVFAIAKQMRSDDPTQGIILERPTKSSGHMTWLEPQVEQFRNCHALGTTARLALELLLNIAARRYDAHQIGPQHVILSNKDGIRKLCWRPHKTLRTSGKLLKVRMLPSLQAAIDAMPTAERGSETALAFLTNDYGRQFASAAAFGNKFADWCRAADLKPVLCEDGRTRNYRAHGLRKAALRALAHAGCTLHELMAVSGHASSDELQKYLEEVEQEHMADKAMDKLLSATGTGE
jgi:integrase/recombinase XerD